MTGHAPSCAFWQWRTAGSPKPEGRPFWLGPGCDCGHPDQLRAQYRVWDELVPPLPGWYWRLVRRGLAWPTEGMWLARAVRGVRREAARRGWTLIGDPVATAEEVGGRVIVRASCLATGPVDPAIAEEEGPADVVDRGGEVE